MTTTATINRWNMRRSLRHRCRSMTSRLARAMTTSGRRVIGIGRRMRGLLLGAGCVGVCAVPGSALDAGLLELRSRAVRMASRLLGPAYRLLRRGRLWIRLHRIRLPGRVLARGSLRLQPLGKQRGHGQGSQRVQLPRGEPSEERKPFELQRAGRSAGASETSGDRGSARAAHASDERADAAGAGGEERPGQLCQREPRTPAENGRRETAAGGPQHSCPGAGSDAQSARSGRECQARSACAAAKGARTDRTSRTAGDEAATDSEEAGTDAATAASVPGAAS